MSTLNCKHFEICGLQPYRVHGSDTYCILHYPELAKGLDWELKRYLESGKSDFRYMYFPPQTANIFAGRTFSSLADFRWAMFSAAGLGLEGVQLTQGLNLHVENIQRIDLRAAKINGALNLTIEDTVHEIILTDCESTAPVNIIAGRCLHIDASQSRFTESFKFQCRGTVDLFDLSNSTLSKSILIDIPNFREINFVKAQCAGEVQLQTQSGKRISGNSALFNGDVKIEGESIETLAMQSAQFSSNIAIHGRFIHCSFSLATVPRSLHAENSAFIDLSALFDTTNFGPTSELHLNNALFAGELKINGSPRGPNLIDIDNATITGNFTVHAELGADPVKIIASKTRARFQANTSFVNVDLSQCKLLGNSFARIEISNVKWARRFSRNVLYDEIMWRKEKSAPWSNLKEAYQILKERYRQMGDNATAGDFHYGEMESKRREWGWPKRGFCPEVFYWIFSGYGVGYIRAFLFLLAFVFGFAIFYLHWGGIALNRDFERALLFSFQTAILIRPEFPYAFTRWGHWAYNIESILVPVQAALFVLALRMRLKR